MKNTENSKFRKQEQFSKKTNPVWFLFLKTVIENTENTILVFSENSCFCSPNLVFYVCSLCFLEQKKYGNQIFFLCFPCSPCFSEQKKVFKNRSKYNVLCFQKLFLRIIFKK